MATFEEHNVEYEDGRTVFYLAFGPRSGPLLIFMHGWPGIGKTWHDQLSAFASLGFRVVAPDMPGYGKSSARKLTSDYRQELIVKGMLAVLDDTGRRDAIWVGHDWGCATVWTLANTHPRVCRAVASLCVPYRTLELGLEELLTNINRDIYPEDEYPYGQWSYQVFYETNFEKVVGWMDKDAAGFLKALMRKADPSTFRQAGPTSNVVKDGGWFGGADKPPSVDKVPDDNSAIDSETFSELVAAMRKTGFYPGSSWYMNHKTNREYNLSNSKAKGMLHMPVLFIHAKYDPVCDTTSARQAEPMRRYCTSLTEVMIDSDHWVLSEKPQETNAAITRWIVEEVTDWWPGYWVNGFVKHKGYMSMMSPEP